jgi:hypothetical protein
MNYHIHVTDAMCDVMECMVTQLYLNTANYLQHHLPPTPTLYHDNQNKSHPKTNTDHKAQKKKCYLTISSIYAQICALSSSGQYIVQKECKPRSTFTKKEDILYTFFWVIARRLNFICRHFGTHCLFHLHK